MKLLLKFTAVIIFILMLSFSAFAAEENRYYKSQLEASGAHNLFSSINDESKDILASLGIDSIDFDTLFDISPQKVFSSLKDIAEGKAKEPIKAVVKILGTVVMLSMGEAFLHDDKKMKSMLNVTGILLCVAALSVPVYQAIEAAISSVGICCVFMKTLIPVLAGVLIASGNPMTAASFQTWAFAAAQFISSICQSFVIPVVGAVVALDISGSLLPEYKFNSITSFIKKTVISVLSFTATLYVSFLGIKNALSSSADSVAGKGIKLLISSAVPVVGGALSEAYSGIIGSLTLVKSSVGVFGIISVAVITLPSVLNLIFWIFALKLCAAAGEIFGQNEISGLLSSLSSALTLVNVVLLFNCVLFIISMALLLNLK